MLYFRIGETGFINNAIKRCIEFLKDPMFPKEGGTVDVGEGMRCIVSQYITLPESDSIWEAHRKYADVHCVLEGEEIIRIAHTNQSVVGEYHEENDYLEVGSQASAEIRLNRGSALCLLPNDAHQVKLQVHEGIGEQVTKVVFKIPLELF